MPACLWCSSLFNFVVLCCCSDLTAATWGGSTVQSDPEDTTSSVSLPSDIAADITQESTVNPGGKYNS